MIGYIYCHTSPSGKKYIGLTTTSLEHRYNNGENYKSSPAFWKAIQKYGWDNFSHEVLEEVECEDKQALVETLNFLERKYISEYNSIVPYGYNIEAGGGQGRVLTEKRKQISATILGKKTPSKELLEQLYLKENKTMKEIGEILNITRECVSKWLKWYCIPINYQHRTTKKVSKEELEQYYLKEQHTQKECCEYFKISTTILCNLIKKYGLYKRKKK